MKNKIIIGLTEEIILYSESVKPKLLKARIDTGATRSSIDTKLAASMKFKLSDRTKIVKSAHGSTVRPIVHGRIKLARHLIDVDFTITNRDHMKYQVLIGQDVLQKKAFLIDPMKG